MGDWLGTGKTATFDRNYRSFRAARAFARSLGLKNGYEWSDFAKGNLPGKGALPGDIPAAPFTVYIKDGWKGMGDWLGTGNIAATKYKWLSFKKARSFVQKLGLRGQREWVKYCKGEMPEIGIRPPNIPTDPRVVYGEKGFVGYGDWLGTGAVQTNKRVFRSFKEARKFARGLCLKNSSEWFAFCRGDLQRTKGKRPGDIPTSPKVVYVNKGWEGFGDWLGTGAVGKTKRVFRSFKDARKFARKLGLKSYAEWGAYCRGDFQRTKGKLPKDIPKDPRSAYKNKGWLSVGDWLGKKT